MRMGEEGKNGRIVIGCMQIYRGGFRKKACLEREREREKGKESKGDSQTYLRERGRVIDGRKEETTASESC